MLYIITSFCTSIGREAASNISTSKHSLTRYLTPLNAAGKSVLRPY